MSPDTMRRGRFDQSFVVRMIKDFFLVLLIVVVAELGVRFALVIHDFYTEQRERTEDAAVRLASDVRRIMMNTGGPVAARTVYPILDRNHEGLGLDIAVEPTEITVKSIEERFDFTPRGIPARWRAGTNHMVTIPIEADSQCLGCHGEAKAGDVLGTVTVRNYLSTHVALWWEEVRLTGLMSLLKIMLHTTVLFFLLRIRMEPLLALRSVVSGLAKGGSDLSLRAPVNTTDEFGELAADLNHFLDRICQIVDDLRSVLDKVASLNHRLEAIQAHMGESTERMAAGFAQASATLRGPADGDALLTPEWRESVETLRDVLASIAHDRPAATRLTAAFDRVTGRLSEMVDRAARLSEARGSTEDALAGLSGEFRTIHRLVGEMAILEEKMDRIAESGRTLVDRLQVAPSSR